MNSELTELIKNWRINYPDFSFPDFDPISITNPKVLILLESPGPKVKDSRIVSITNNDPTARNLSLLSINTFGSELISREKILLWNAVPWHLNEGEKIKSIHIDLAKTFHLQLIEVLKERINTTVFLGRVARDLIPFYSGQFANCRFFAGHHTGGKAQKSTLIEENKRLFEQLKSLL